MAALSKIGKGAAGKIGALSDWVSEGIWFRGSRSNEETIKPFTNVTLDEQLAKNYASPTTEQSNITTMKLMILKTLITLKWQKKKVCLMSLKMKLKHQTL